MLRFLRGRSAKNYPFCSSARKLQPEKTPRPSRPGGIPDIYVREQGRHTLLHILGPLNALPDLLVVAHAGIGAEGLVQARAEVRVAEGVLSAEVEELWGMSVRVFRSVSLTRRQAFMCQASKYDRCAQMTGIPG